MDSSALQKNLPLFTTLVSRPDHYPTAEELHAVITQLADVLRQSGAGTPPADLHPTALAAELRQLPPDNHARPPIPSRHEGIVSAQLAIAHQLGRSIGNTNAPVIQHLRNIATMTPARPVTSTESTPPPTTDLTSFLRTHHLCGKILLPTATGRWAIAPIDPCDPTSIFVPADTDRIDLAQEVLAQATALLGAPFVLTTHDLLVPSLFTWAWRAISDLVMGDTVIGCSQAFWCIPVYRWEGDATQTTRLCAVLTFEQMALRPPPTTRQWCELLRQCPLLVPHLTHRPQTESDAQIIELTATADMRTPSWRTHVAIIDPDTPHWLPPPPRHGLSTFPTAAHAHLDHTIRWLQALAEHSGLPTAPPELQPMQLKQELSQLMSHVAVDQLSTSTERSAQHLSQSAWHEHYTKATGELLQQASQQLKTRHLLMVAFGRYQPWDNAFDVQCAPAGLSDAVRASCRLLCHLGLLLGTPHFIAPDDTANKVLALAREALEEQAAALLVPVFDWSTTDQPPRFEGIFLALYDNEAQPPTRVQWLQWLFFCQVMHDPVGVIGARMDKERLLRESMQDAMPRPLFFD